MKVKICGITSVADANIAISGGASAIGLVFCQPSKRFLSIQSAQDIIESLPPFTVTVGLFMNQSVQEVQKILKSVAINLLQFHGDESFEYCQSFNHPYIKVFKPENFQNCNPLFFSSPLMRAYLLDAGAGTGKTFAWQNFVDNHPQIKNIKKPLILAGGLHADNVRCAINIIKPYAVDVSSGVEDELNPPHKSLIKITNFMSVLDY